MNNPWFQPIDFFATRSHYVDHLAPIWFEMEDELRGEFYVPICLKDYADAKGIKAIGLQPTGINRPLEVAPSGSNPIIVCSYRDYQLPHRRLIKRPIFYMEHGVGISFGNSGYAGSGGERKGVCLFLNPNDHTQQLNAKAYPDIPGEIIGTPKLDAFFNPLRTSSAFPQMQKNTEFGGRKVTVCISFHWDGRVVAPEAGNAFEYYKSVLPALAACEDFTLIGHAHPRIADEMKRFYAELGIEFVSDFEEIMKRTDVYINDCSSTMYEFCVTGKPVIILNAPQFRHLPTQGLRFWKYTDIGPQVNQLEELLPTIQRVLAKDEYELPRAKAANDLYPYWGCAAERAVEVIKSFVEAKRPVVRRVEQIRGESIGIIYMAFGQKAAQAVRQSMLSLKNIGLDIPVCVVGDAAVRGAQFIEWKGESPFDASERHNFQFRAGRVKPFLYDLSPFARTLYIDADTEFITDITPAFELLDNVDIALAEEIQTIGQLYNKPSAGWEINIKERDATIAQLGSPNIKFLNSGVIFFRKSPETKILFEEWHKQWMTWKQWDEQLALMRSIHQCKIKYEALDVNWNHPHREQAKFIFHNYGRCAVRSDVTA